jgi:ketosteroid isomerase-like protein
MFKKTVAVFGLVLTLMLCGNANVLAKDASGVAGVQAADGAWLKAYTGGQLENVVALYDENAIVYPPASTPVQGRAAIQEFFAKDMAAFAKSGLVMTLGANPSGGTSGDLGWSSGTWEVKDNAGKVVDSGWYFSVSKKKAGKWLYVRDSWDSSNPTPPATTGGN